MNNMEVELFTMSWVQSIVLFFSYLTWSFYGTGLVVAVFEVGIEYQHGRGSIIDITSHNLVTGYGELVFFMVKPTNISILSERNVRARIYVLMNALRYSPTSPVLKRALKIGVSQRKKGQIPP